jgi:hypothetical protein
MHTGVSCEGWIYEYASCAARDTTATLPTGAKMLSIEPPWQYLLCNYVMLSLTFNAVPMLFPCLMPHHSETIRRLCQQRCLYDTHHSIDTANYRTPQRCGAHDLHRRSTLEFLANLGHDFLYPRLLDLLLCVLDGVANLEDVPTSLAEVGSETEQGTCGD